MDGRQDSGRADGCPEWCEGEHDDIGGGAERLHRSAASSVPLVQWPDRGPLGRPEALLVHVSLCRPGPAGEVRIRLEADALGVVDLDLSGAARLAGAIDASLLLRGAAR